jgi:hypothetical protein
MGDPIFTGVWESHIVLACMTCEEVVLLSRKDIDREAARISLHAVIDLLSVELINVDYQENREIIVSLFLPTICSSCSKYSSWKTFSIKRSFIEMWQPYLALCAFLEGDLSLLGSSINVVHCEDVKNVIGSSYVMQSVKVNPSSRVAAQVEPHLRSGFF